MLRKQGKNLSAVQLKKNDGFRWFEKDNIYAKGFIYSHANEVVDAYKLCKFFSRINHTNDLIQKLYEANGHFSVVIVKKDFILAAVDRLRTFPLFYSVSYGKPIISDDPDQIIKITGLKTLNQFQKEEFLATGFVSGFMTLVKDLYQVQTGACISIQNNKIKQIFYHSYETTETTTASYGELYKDFRQIIYSSFSRFIKSLRGRTVILSLSGGFDSRLIGIMLKKMKYNNVICFSYGKKNNTEAEISKRVAGILGFEWKFVEYNNELINDYLNDPVFQNYFPYSANYTSMFFMEQYFAVKALKEKYLIPFDSIFCAGHSGDFLGGSQLVKNGNIKEAASVDQIARAIFKIKYAESIINNADEHIDQIENWLTTNTQNPESLAYSIFENWDLKEKIAKFIFNSSNVYNYFGFEHRLPLMDNEIFDFFRTAPYKFKLHKKLYDDVLMNEFFDQYNLNFSVELRPTRSQIKRQQLKNKLYSFMPDQLLSKIRQKNDLVSYSEITKLLIQDALKDGFSIHPKGKNFNSVIIEWYIHQLGKKFS